MTNKNKLLGKNIVEMMGAGKVISGSINLNNDDWAYIGVFKGDRITIVDPDGEETELTYKGNNKFIRADCNDY